MSHMFQLLILCVRGKLQTPGISPCMSVHARVWFMEISNYFETSIQIHCTIALLVCGWLQLRDMSQPGAFPSDVTERADALIAGVRSTGAYSHSKGAAVCREMVAAGIHERDGYPADPESIFMTDGASPAVHNLLRLTVRSSQDAWLVPIPQYPLYSAGLQLAGGTLLPYYLDEQSGWSLNTSTLQELVDQVWKILFEWQAPEARCSTAVTRELNN